LQTLFSRKISPNPPQSVKNRLLQKFCIFAEQIRYRLLKIASLTPLNFAGRICRPPVRALCSVPDSFFFYNEAAQSLKRLKSTAVMDLSIRCPSKNEKSSSGIIL
jgi:hypothetical protein